MITVLVVGAPRTKKTSNQLALAGGRTILVPSKAWIAWERTAEVYVDGKPWPRLDQKHDRRQPPAADRPWNARAMIYREAAVGDAVGFYQGLADLLERRRILSDDRWLFSWDGTRCLVDRAHPRVELVLEPLDVLTGSVIGAGCVSAAEHRTLFAEEDAV